MLDSILDVDQVEYELVFEKTRALEVIEILKGCDYWAFDLETTSLSPREGEVRLSQFYNGKQLFVFDHWNCGSFKELAPKMVGPTYVAFYANFELTWCDNAVPDETFEVWDVGLMSKAVLGGGHLSLADMCKRDLGIVLDKEAQTSNWALFILTDAQLNYAAYDAYVTWLLFEKWSKELDDRDNWFGFHVFNDAIRGNNEMEATALQLDIPYHEKNLRLWEKKRAIAKRVFEKYTPESIIKNINSNLQVSRFLEAELHEDTLAAWPRTPAGKQLNLERSTCLAMAYNMPYPMSRWFVAFVIYRYWNKYISTYGETLINKQKLEGKVSSRFNIAAARTGRYSSANANLQNIPRKPYIRKAFFSPPEGIDTMVLADYSGIEVRVLAELSKDKQLLHDAIYDDVHMQGSAQINGIDPEEYREVLDNPDSKWYYDFKEKRSKAKVFTFRLCVAEGTLITTDRGDVPIQHVTTGMKVWDGQEFVTHDGPVYNGVKEVVQNDTLTATPDHDIYGADGTVRPFAHLVFQGNECQFNRVSHGGSPVRYNDPFERYYQEERERRDALLPLLRMWQSAEEMAAQYFEWTLKHVLLSAQPQTRHALSSDSRVARTILGDERALQTIRSKLVLLRTARDQKQFQRLRRVYNAYQKIVSFLNSGAVENAARRQDRQRWTLRAGQRAASLLSGKPTQSSHVWDLLNCGPRHRYTAGGVLVSNTYGAGLGALAQSLRRPLDQTQVALDKWIERYPLAYNYRRIMNDYMMQDGMIPICDGRTVYVPKFDRTLPVAANYPIQGAAASVMYRAVYHVRKLYIERDISAVLAATVHDELLSYCWRSEAEAGKIAKIDGMTQGWLDVFPNTDTNNLIDSAIGDTWAAKP